MSTPKGTQDAPNLLSAVARATVVGIAAAACPVDGGVVAQLVFGASGNALWELACKVPGLGRLFARKITEPKHWLAAAFARALADTADRTAKGKCLEAFKVTHWWKEGTGSAERKAIEDFYNALHHTGDHDIAAGLAAGFTDAEFRSILSDPTGAVSAQLMPALRDTALSRCTEEFQDWFIAWQTEFFPRLFLDQVLTDPPTAARWLGLQIECVSEKLDSLDRNDQTILTLLRNVHRAIVQNPRDAQTPQKLDSLATRIAEVFGDKLDLLKDEVMDAKIAAQQGQASADLAALRAGDAADTSRATRAEVQSLGKKLDARQPFVVRWHLPKYTTHLFGREQAIPDVAELIAKHPSVVLVGPGGVGKTVLAFAAILHHAGTGEERRHFQHGILYHDCYADPSHDGALRSILDQTGCDAEGLLKQPTLQAAENETTTQLSIPDRLLYLEGCEKAADLDALLRLVGGTRILLTTRDHSQADRGVAYRVGLLSDDAAAALIRFHRGKGTPDECLPLARMLGGHPLSCERSGIQLRLDVLTPAQLQQRLEKKGLPLIHPRRSAKDGRDHEHTAVGHLLQMDAEAVAKVHPLAMRAWAVLAFGAFAPVTLGPVPERDRRVGIADDAPEMIPGLLATALETGEEEAEEAVHALQTRSLAIVESICISHTGEEERHVRLTHALLAEHARPFETTLPYAFPLPREEAMPLARRWTGWWKDTVSRWNKAGHFPGSHVRYRVLLPHLDLLPTRAAAACTQASQPDGADDPSVLFLISELGFLHDTQGQFNKAKPLYEGALETSERTLGREHPSTLTSVNNLAYLRENQGDFTGAESLYERALEARERTLGREHPNTLNSVNNLALLRKNKGDYAGAEPLLEWALEARERTLGREHPNTLLSMNNLAMLREGKGDYAGAEPLFERALEAMERTLGREHPSTLSSVNNLAELRRSKGDYAGAEPLYDRALEAMERTLGREHPSTLIGVNNLAYLHENKGDYAGAEQLHERALEARERTLGREHPDTLISLNNLGLLRKNKGDYAGAEPLVERALEARERTLGREHPDTLISLNNLAVLRYHQERIPEALELMRRALAGRERVFGPQHPNTIQSRESLDILLKEAAEAGGAGNE